MPNQLCHELSLYLLEHAENPVDWRPWGEEAIALARATEKPIFLSIGYSACHWCHVMARESFEDPDIARLLNEQFVSIKVDREERPELDQIYMEAVQAMTGNGGWPLSVFLTPECEPFFGGTYWPPRAGGSASAARPGMAGFDQVLQAVAEAWQGRRDEVRRQAGRITSLLKSQARHGLSQDHPEPPAPGLLAKSLEEISREAESRLRSAFDPAHGGFSAAPKFPQPLAVRWLLRRWRLTGDEALLRMAVATLDGMAAGGIFDHLGGGFHRYTVDARWLVPHFEKMLYDNAMLALCYVEAWQATGQPRYAAVARQTLDYLLADLSGPQGGFCSAEDADSEGREGAFYLWTPSEVEALLEPETARTFCRVYDVTDEGNFEGCNILHLSRPLEVDAKMLGRDGAELAAELAAARQTLLAARRLRIRPKRDEKVLVCWNSLAIEALACAGAALGEPRYTAAAATAAEFLLANLRSADGRLLHCWRAGVAKHNAYLDDYAGLAAALVAMDETNSVGCVQRTGAVRSTHPTWLDLAAALADDLLTRFTDAEQGGFFYTSADHEPLIVRRKDAIDAPVPSGNGLAVSALLRLGAILRRDKYREAAEGTLLSCLPILRAAPTATFQLLIAADEPPAAAA